MSYEMTTGRVWPTELIEGEYPSRGQKAVQENDRAEMLMKQGWEPFAVVPEEEATQIFFRRKKS